MLLIKFINNSLPIYKVFVTGHIDDDQRYQHLSRLYTFFKHLTTRGLFSEEKLRAYKKMFCCDGIMHEMPINEWDYKNPRV